MCKPKPQQLAPKTPNMRSSHPEPCAIHQTEVISVSQHPAAHAAANMADDEVGALQEPQLRAVSSLELPPELVDGPPRRLRSVGSFSSLAEPVASPHTSRIRAQQLMMAQTAGALLRVNGKVRIVRSGGRGARACCCQSRALLWHVWRGCMHALACSTNTSHEQQIVGHCPVLWCACQGVVQHSCTSHLLLGQQHPLDTTRAGLRRSGCAVPNGAAHGAAG